MRSARVHGFDPRERRLHRRELIAHVPPVGKEIGADLI
jgi:hypothetical protein